MDEVSFELPVVVSQETFQVEVIPVKSQEVAYPEVAFPEEALSVDFPEVVLSVEFPAVS